MKAATEFLARQQSSASGPGGSDFCESLLITRRKDGSFTVKAWASDETGIDHRSCSRPFKTAKGFFLGLGQTDYALSMSELGSPPDDQVRTMLPVLLQLAPDLEGEVRALLVTGQQPSEDDDAGVMRPESVVSSDDVVDAVLAGSRCAQALVFRWFD